MEDPALKTKVGGDRRGYLTSTFGLHTCMHEQMHHRHTCVHTTHVCVHAQRYTKKDQNKYERDLSAKMYKISWEKLKVWSTETSVFVDLESTVIERVVPWQWWQHTPAGGWILKMWIWGKHGLRGETLSQGKNAVLTKISDRLIRVLIKFLAVFLVSIDNPTPNAYER